MNDTAPEVENMVRDRVMALSGAERLRMGAAMFEAARRMVLASLPAGLPELERKRRLYERVYGESLPLGACTPSGEDRTVAAKTAVTRA